MEAKILNAEEKTQIAEEKTQQAEAKTQQAEAKTQQAIEQLISISNSKSWRYTASFRCLLAWFKKLLVR